MTASALVPVETSPAARAAWIERRRRLLGRMFAPRPRLTLSQWADQYRRLSSESSATNGPWRTDRVPYMREIMDAISDPAVPEVVIMKSAQIGYTQAVVLNAIAYFMHQDPAPVLVVQPSDGDAQQFSKEKLAPMLRDTPALRGLVEDKARSTGNTILSKSFPGGLLRMTGATSPKGLAASSNRVVLFDECDRFPASAGPEGDPISIARKRQITFYNAKTALGSTPVLKGFSRIEKAWESTDQRRYHVPCPHCGTLQPLVWAGLEQPQGPGLVWTGEDPEAFADPVYVCVEGCVIEETHKLAMLARGQWIATQPARQRRGYHISALYSPFEGASWRKIVREYLEVRHDPERLKPWVNTMLGEPFEEKTDAVDGASLLARRVKVDPPVPAWAGVLTRSVDVQGNRLETAVWAWGAGEQAVPVETEIIEGDPGTDAPWLELEEHLTRTYLHASGVRLRPRITFLDSGGHHTKEAYAWAEQHRRQRVFPIKGMNSEGAPLVKRSSSKGGVQHRLVLVGSFTGKESLASRLRMAEPGPKYIHLPTWFDEEQVKQLTAEQLTHAMHRGRKMRYWKQVYDRNEQTDLFVYALAALHFLGPRLVAALGAIAEGLKPPPPPDAPPANPAVPPAPLPRPRPPRRGWIRDPLR